MGAGPVLHTGKMITISNVSLSFGEGPLFREVNIKFTPGNCYGVIGANGAGKSTFLKILSGELEPDTGEISISPGSRLGILRQDQFQFDEYSVMDTVIMGHARLYQVRQEKDALYEREDFTEEDGIRAAELEAEFAELGGWEAEADASRLLSGLGLDTESQKKQMGELDGAQKVRVLLAQALFGDPDIVLLDEPTNNLDLESIAWLEDFLLRFNNTVIVVSHDRHFLDRVCTHIADIDYGRIQLFVGNYDFWYHSSQLARQQLKNEKKRREEKIAELKTFIQRFASNAAKAKQATSRQKLIEKLTIDDIKPSSRKAPYIRFEPAREPGKVILHVEGLKVQTEGETSAALSSFDLSVQPDDKIAFVGPYHQSKTSLFRVLVGEDEPLAGTIEWGATITSGYYPNDANPYFESAMSITDWLRQYSEVEEESYVRGFLGRMLFSGEESLKPVSVLSGGEKARCMFSRLMLTGPNVLIMDEPTNHLDLESIEALNDAMIDFRGPILFTSHDHKIVSTVANRIIEFTPEGLIDRRMPFDDYLASEEIRALRDAQYRGQHLAVQI